MFLPPPSPLQYPRYAPMGKAMHLGKGKRMFIERARLAEQPDPDPLSEPLQEVRATHKLKGGVGMGKQGVGGVCVAHAPIPQSLPLHKLPFERGSAWCPAPVY
jgi:hypothetical protein